MPKEKTSGGSQIAQNKAARHDYFIEKQFEAGLVLMGWEVKSLRAGRAQIKESHVLIKKSELWLLGAHLSPLSSASTHVVADPIRTRKLLMHGHEIRQLIGAVERKGYALVPLNLYWKNGRAKLEVGLAKGKKEHDKRDVAQDRDWSREKGRLMKQKNRLG